MLDKLCNIRHFWKNKNQAKPVWPRSNINRSWSGHFSRKHVQARGSCKTGLLSSLNWIWAEFLTITKSWSDPLRQSRLCSRRGWWWWVRECFYEGGSRPVLAWTKTGCVEERLFLRQQFSDKLDEWSSTEDILKEGPLFLLAAICNFTNSSTFFFQAWAKSFAQGDSLGLYGKNERKKISSEITKHI